MASHELAGRRVRVLPLQLVLCTAAVSANVYEYNSQPLEPNVIQYRRVGMWTKAEAPAHVGDGRSQVELDVRLARPAPAGAGLVQVLVFHSSELGIIGVHGVDGSRTLCCTSELIQMGACSREGSVVVRGDGEGDEEQPGVWLRDMEFSPGQATASLSAEVQVARSGVHYLLFSSCMSQTGTVLLSGRTAWFNPHGYLPAELYAFLPFFKVMTLAYVGLGLVWAGMCFHYRAVLLPLQTYIGGVILLGAAESAIWYLDYFSFNRGGVRGVSAVVMGVLASTLKKTVSRVLVLGVGLGYGVVRPTLGSTGYKLLGFGLLYFCFSAILDVASNVSQLSEASTPLRLLCILPVALLDALLYCWVLTGLTATLSQLTSRRQSAKLLLYRRFSYVLLASVVVSVVWVCWQMATILSDSLDQRWATLWLFDAFWHVLYFVLLLAVCSLWSPSKNNLQYAYMDEVGQEDELQAADHDDAQ